jgi:putative transposase
MPAPARILHERSGPYIPANVARMPEVKLAPESDDTAVDLDSAGHKRHPSQSTLRPKLARNRGQRLCESRDTRKLTADGLHGVGMQTQLRTAASAQLDQVEGRRPSNPHTGFPASLSFALRRDAVVPHLVACDGVSVQVPLGRSVLDAVFETQDHASTCNWSEPNMQDYRTGRHCVFKLHAHLVFVTKYRRDVLSELAVRDLAAIFSKVCRDFAAVLVECSGEDDHVHLLVEYPPRVCLSRLVNSLKGVSSRRLRQQRPEVTGRYFKSVLWSPSYFAASCGGAPVSIIRQYIEQQRSREAAPPPRPKVRGIRRRELR